MNIPGLNGGLLILVLAAIWLAIFTPALKHRSEFREQHREQKAAAHHHKQTQLNRLNSAQGVRAAVSFRRLSLARKFTAWMSLVTFVSTIVFVFQIGTNDLALALTGPSAALTTLLFLTNVSVTRAQRKLLNERSQVRRTVPSIRVDELLNGSAQAQQELLSEEDRLMNERKWNATRIPSQLYRSETGTLETPELAEVVSLDEKLQTLEAEKRQKTFENSETTRINIDEILRRRRANGS